MTTNHPAHGPVSLDRLHQISEILSKAAAQSDGGNLGYAMADAVKVIDGVISAEPVGEVSEQRDGLVMDGTVDLGGTSTHRIIKGASKMKRLPIGTKFYTYQPATVVPDGMKELLRLVECMLVDYRENNFGHASEWIRHISSASDSFENEHFLSPWLWAIKSCRAAMIQAGNPQVIPGYWVACSGRMPEGMQTVITSNGFDIGQGWWDGECWKSFDCHDVVPGKVTHWMPLPASPHFREIGNSSTNNCRENAKTSTNQASLNSNVTIDCWCHTCRPVTMSDMRFVVCPDCGNKRCPHANDHRNDCTGSNEPGQIGSAYQAAPKQGE